MTASVTHRPQTVCQRHALALGDLIHRIMEGHPVVLIESLERATGQKVALIAFVTVKGEEVSIQPVARMIDNLEDYAEPDPDGGFRNPRTLED